MYTYTCSCIISHSLLMKWKSAEVMCMRRGSGLFFCFSPMLRMSFIVFSSRGTTIMKLTENRQVLPSFHPETSSTPPLKPLLMSGPKTRTQSSVSVLSVASTRVPAWCQQPLYWWCWSVFCQAVTSLPLDNTCAGGALPLCSQTTAFLGET